MKKPGEVFATTLDAIMPSADEYGRIPTDEAPVTSSSTLSPIIHNASAPAMASRISSKARGSCS